MKKLILFIILLSAINCNAQIWDNVGGGITLTSKYHTYLGVRVLVNDTIHHYLYVGGEFDSAGHKPIQNLARWDGKNWSGMGNFNDTAILSMCMYNDSLVIGDYLDNVTFIDSAGNILNIFSADGFVNSLTVYKNELYAGGDFDEINGVNAVGIARYNGINWESVDSGMKNCCGNGDNWALYVWNGKLYAAGAYYQAGDSLANNIASWNDTTWSPLGTGTNTKGTGKYDDGYIYSMGSYDNDLYIGGQFDSAGGVSTKWIARWNGIKWDSLGSSINESAYDLFAYRNYLYMSGFDSAGGMSVRGLTKWNDTLFSSVDSGINGFAAAIDTFNKELYFAGFFNYAGSLPVNNIARCTLDTTTTDIKQIGNNKELVSVYPNPTSGETTITSSKNIQYIKVTDLLGQLIYEAQPKQSKFTFDLKETGIYFVTVTSGDVIETKKVVVVR